MSGFGTLYIVPTPIGNLEDMTFRAIRVLKEVALVACEDTRTSAVLFEHYGIETPRTSFHAHNEHGKADSLIRRLMGGADLALVSDAGTPGISDPGYLLVRAALDTGIHVEALPGATAFTTALSASGLPSDRFVFEGFLPHKKGRKTRLEVLSGDDRTVIFYESPHRLPRLIRELGSACGTSRQAVVGRELTKKFEEYRRGTLAELAEWADSQSRIRGEIVMLLASEAASERLGTAIETAIDTAIEAENIGTESIQNPSRS